MNLRQWVSYDRKFNMDWNSPLYSYLQILKSDRNHKKRTNFILLGDSRVRDLTREPVEDQFGFTVMNLAMGGAALSENISFFNSQLPHIDRSALKSVIISVPFIRFCDTIPINRMNDAIETYKSHWDYYSDNYVFIKSIESFQYLFRKIVPLEGWSSEKPTGVNLRKSKGLAREEVVPKVEAIDSSQVSDSTSKREKFLLVKQMRLPFKSLSYPEQAEYLHRECAKENILSERKKLSHFVNHLEELDISYTFWAPMTRPEVADYTLNGPFAEDYQDAIKWLNEKGPFYNFFLNGDQYGIERDYLDILHLDHKNRKNIGRVLSILMGVSEQTGAKVDGPILVDQ